MKKRLVLLLILALLMVGCNAPDTPATEPPAASLPEQTDPPTQPENGETLEDLRALFDWENEWVYNMAAGHVYTSPAEVDLYYIFYNGVHHDGSWGALAEADRELLVSRGFWQEIDIQIMPAHLLEQDLRQYFGVGLADVKIPDEWAYSAETDTYYSNHNDAYGSLAVVNGYDALEDGTLRLQLTVDAVHDHDFEEVIWDAPMYMTLRPTADGYQIVSNVPADQP